MPTYTYTCPACGHQRDEILPMAERDTRQFTCVHYSGYPSIEYMSFAMVRETAYSVRLMTNEASVWPQVNNALVPIDPAMERKYREKGWLVKDPIDPRGEIVKCESEAHFKHMCKEQGLTTDGDYEKLGRSGPSRRKKPGKVKDRPDQKKAKEKARQELREMGLLK